MLTAVHVYNELGNKLELPMDATGGYVIKNIEGLGPVKADIITTEYAGMDGGVYQNANGNMRNIVIQIGFDPSYESDDPFGELRRGLYSWLTPKMKVDMQFLSTNMETVKLVGYVESFEPSIFSADPEVQISILCPDPYFSSLVPIVVGRAGSGLLNVINPGTIKSGFLLTIQSIWVSEETNTAFVLERIDPSYDSMTYIGPLYWPGSSLRTIQINTNKGSKSAGWMYNTEYNIGEPFIGENLIGYIDGWINIVPGVNNFQINFPSEILGSLSTYLSFIPRYVGL